jgi:4-alpha-glucanotransferase
MAWGIDDKYFDISGQTQVLPDAVRLRLMEAMGLGPGAGDHPPPVPLRFIGPGRSRALDGRGKVVLEDGSQISVQGELPADLPFGYHRLIMDGGSEEIRLFVSPRACLLPPKRMTGFSAQLYAARSQRSWGIGDLADLRLLVSRTREKGLDALLVNPLGAVPPIHPQESSPYSPSSRRYLNPLYLAVEEVPGARESLDLERLSQEGRTLCSRPMIDRDAIYDLKMGALAQIFEKTRPEVHAGESLLRFSSYCALAEIHGADWRRWPEGLRRPDSPAVAHFRNEHRRRIELFAWLQELLDRQLANASSEGVILDLPIGFRSDGADAWEWQDLLALNVSIGAPPDAFARDGQDWGLPPFVPHKLRAAFYQPFIETVRAVIHRAGGLRIDHVMGLFRLFWVPHGLGAKNGGYVRFQSDELLDILAIESHRAGAFVIGEDLGTVEEGVREQLYERNILSCKLLWFEPAKPEHWPERALASVTTHDLPMIAGVWNRLDHAPEQRDRLRDWGGIADDAPVEVAIQAARDLLKRSPCLLTLMQLEDAFASGQRPNVPGTTDRPNWCLPLPGTIEGIDFRPI